MREKEVGAKKRVNGVQCYVQALWSKSSLHSDSLQNTIRDEQGWKIDGRKVNIEGHKLGKLERERKADTLGALGNRIEARFCVHSISLIAQKAYIQKPESK